MLKTINESPDYHPVFLNDFAPEDRFDRRKWINKLQLPVTIFMYRYPHGNNLGTLNFAWKVPIEIDPTQNQRTIAQLNNSQKLFYTREVRREFLDKYTHLAEKTSLKSKNVLRNIFRSLVHDESAPSSHVEAEVNDRLAKYLLDMDDPDIVLDLRKLNGKPSSSKFDVFWLELHNYLEEIGPAVQERHHGEAMYMPVAISVNHLREIISSKVKEKFPQEEVPIPSLEWMRLQFLPRNPYTATALKYTGKFNVRYAVQCRQLRHEHPDSKYVAVILRYAKEFAVLHSELMLMISVDDKAIVPVGEPHLPVSTGVRGHHRSLVVSSSSTLRALDHDFHVAGIVPSVAFFPCIPSKACDSFFSGPVYITLKDKVLQPSGAMRHATELIKIIKSNFSSHAPRVVLLTSDGVLIIT